MKLIDRYVYTNEHARDDYNIGNTCYLTLIFNQLLFAYIGG